MYFTLFGSGYSTYLVDGWSAYDSGYYDWYHTLGGGQWDAFVQYRIFGNVPGEGFISGVQQIVETFEMYGDVAGVGDIDSVIVYREPIRIYGDTAGEGYVSHRINFGRRRAVFPKIQRNETYGPNDCPICALEYIGFSPNKVLKLTSYEDILHENTAEYYNNQLVSKSNDHFPLDHYQWFDSSSGLVNYLVTDFKSAGQNGEALYHQYELMFDVFSSEDGDLLTVYKNNEIVVSPGSYVIQYSYDLLASNTRYGSTTWGKLDRSQDIHRVRILVPLSFVNKDDFFTVSYRRYLYGAVVQRKELVELVPVYNQNVDYSVGESGLYLLSGSKIATDKTALNIIKRPKDRIRPIGIEPPSYQPDEISSWRLRINPGSILVNSGYYTSTSGHFYYLGNPYETEYVPITNVKPTFISEGVIKVDQAPIYIDTDSYVYPSYEVPLYDKKDTSLVTDLGKVSIEVNGVARNDLRISSVDREKGFFMINTLLNPSDEIELNFYVSPTGYMTVENLELNPKIRDGSAHFHISGYTDGLGIAMRPYNSSDDNTWFPYIYDTSVAESSRTCEMIPEVGLTGWSLPWSGDSFLKVCDVDLNRLSSEMVKVTDARRPGGGIKDYSELEQWGAPLSGVNGHEFEWYSSVGYYGGAPLSFGSTIIIHVPSGTLFSTRDQWIHELSGQLSDPREARDKGIREFNYYMDRVIRRYISAGSDYILIPVNSNGEFMDIVTLDY